MIEALKSLGFVTILVLLFSYIIYMIGLSLVFKQLNYPAWLAFVPIYNYYVLIQAIGLPKSWFGLAIVPYAGAVYALAISVRLGRIYGRSFAFSSIWLTFGAIVGMFILAFGDHPINQSIIEEPPPKINTKKLQSKIKKRHK